MFANHIWWNRLYWVVEAKENEVPRRRLNFSCLIQKQCPVSSLSPVFLRPGTNKHKSRPKGRLKQDLFKNIPAKWGLGGVLASLN